MAALRNTVSVASVDGTPCLRDIFPEAMALLATNLDLLGSITRILESYILLDAVHVLKVNPRLIVIFLTLTGSRIMPLICSDHIWRASPARSRSQMQKNCYNC